jgi:competence protein ComEA
MLRTLLSIVALSALAIARPVAASPAQASDDRVAVKTAKANTVAPININTASVKELDALPGIGAKTAALIVEYRQKNGPFKKIEELMNVRGVGEKSFLKLRPQLAVTTPTATAAGTDRPKP